MVSAAGMAAALTITQLFDSLAMRIDGRRAWDTTASIRWHFTDTGETYRMELSNGALIHHPTRRTDPADLVITLTRPQLLAMLGGQAPTASSSTATPSSSPPSQSSPISQTPSSPSLPPDLPAAVT